MNYSEFFAMRMELLILAVFLIVFLFDTFASVVARLLRHLPVCMRLRR